MIFRNSTLQGYYRCPKYFELKEILKVPTEEVENASLAFGSGMHMALESFFDGEGHDPLEMFNMYWDTYKDKDIEYPARTTWETYSSDAEIFIDRFKRFQYKHLVPEIMEERFEIDLPSGNKLAGTPDFIGKYKDVVSVVDYKTSGRPYRDDELYSKEQMLIYAHFATLRDITPEQIVYIVFIRTPQGPRIQVKIRPIEQKDIDKTLHNIDTVCKAISETKEFHKNPGGCHMYGKVCPFFETCYGVKLK